jgi:hypothetical protein
MYLVWNGVLITKPEVECDMFNSFFFVNAAKILEKI